MAERRQDEGPTLQRLNEHLMGKWDKIGGLETIRGAIGNDGVNASRNDWTIVWLCAEIDRVDKEHAELKRRLDRLDGGWK